MHMKQSVRKDNPFSWRSSKRKFRDAKSWATHPSRRLPWSETDHAYVKRLAVIAGAASISMARQMPRLVAQRSLGGVRNANLETLKAGQRMHPEGNHGARPTTPM